MKIVEALTARLLCLGFFLISVAFTASAQNAATDSVAIKEFIKVDQLPQYPGGEAELYKFLGANLKYPKEAMYTDIEGRVFVSFIIDKYGKVTDPKIEKGIGGGCDEEALRVISLMGAWEPAKLNGEPVSYAYVLPIKFKLQGRKPKKNKKKNAE